MSISYWLDQSQFSKPQSYDVIIVGAGISGASTAFWLRQEDPDLKIAILEKSEVAAGATGRNAGSIGWLNVGVRIWPIKSGTIPRSI